MCEYIEKEAAIAAAFSATSLGNTAFRDVYDTVNRLRLIPAADVVPVRHGRYIGEYDGYADGCPVFDMWYCSECGYYFEEWDEKPTYNYCPNCGALMDKEDTNG